MRAVLVTGGTRGLGLGIADAFAAHGDSVVVCGRHARAGLRHDFIPCDVRDPAAVEQLIATVLERTGRLDVVVNNAGGSPEVPVAQASPRLAERVIALNLLAPLYVARAAQAVMAPGGVIVNIGSVAAFRPAAGTAAYAAAKAGLTTLTRALAAEWAPDVRVVQVTPGLIRTDMDNYGADPSAIERTVPMGRLAEPADIAAACLLLCDPSLSHTTGTELVVDGGGELPTWQHVRNGFRNG